MFLGQLQRMSSVSGGPHSLGQLESRRVSAVLGLIHTAIYVAGATQDQLKTDKQNGMDYVLYRCTILCNDCMDATCTVLAELYYKLQ